MRISIVAFLSVVLAVMAGATGRAAAQGGDHCLEGYPPSNAFPPKASLSADGTSISTTEGLWQDHGCGVEITYDWKRKGFPIPDGSEATHVLGEEDAGLTLSAEITASNPWGSATATSNGVRAPFTPPSSCVSAPPANTISPSLWEDDSDSILSAVDGSWSSCVSAIAGYEYTWFRNGSPIPGATGDSYELEQVDIGQQIKVRVAAHNESGASSGSASDPVTPTAIGSEPEVVLGDPPSSSDTTTDCFGSVTGETCAGPGDLPETDWVTQFGGKVLERLQDPDIRGVRSAIRTPRRNHFHLPYLSAAVMRVSAERGSSLIQTGFGRMDYWTADCDVPEGWNSNRLYTYYETIAPAAMAGGKLPLCLFMKPVQLARSNLYTVFRKSRTVDIDNIETWEARINGVPVTFRFLKFDAANRAVAGGEIGQKQSPARAHPDGHVYGCYGCSATPRGKVLWQRTTVAGSSNWKNINSARDLTAPDYRSDNRWQVGSLPGPFRVFHRCDPDHSGGC